MTVSEIGNTIPLIQSLTIFFCVDTDAYMSMSAISALTDAIAIDTQLADAVLKQATALQSKFDRHIEYVIAACSNFQHTNLPILFVNNLMAFDRSKDKFDELSKLVGRTTAREVGQ